MTEPKTCVVCGLPEIAHSLHFVTLSDDLKGMCVIKIRHYDDGTVGVTLCGGFREEEPNDAG